MNRPFWVKDVIMVNPPRGPIPVTDKHLLDPAKTPKRRRDGEGPPDQEAGGPSFPAVSLPQSG